MKHRTYFGNTKIYSHDSPAPDAAKVLVVPGFSESVTHMRDLVDAIGEEGFDASSYSQPRRIHRGTDVIGRQGNIVLDILDLTSEQDEKVHVVAHSLGSAAVLRAAREMPERFASITLMQPLGLGEPQTVPELAGRVSKKVIKNQVEAAKGQDPSRRPEYGYTARVDSESRARFSARVARAQAASGVAIAKSPLLSLKEARAAGNTVVEDDLLAVKEHGIPVHIILAHDDEILEHEGQGLNLENSSSISSIADRTARHDTFWAQPKRTARIIRSLIEST